MTLPSLATLPGTGTPLESEPQGTALLRHYCTVRQQSLDLCRPLTPEDMMVQSCPEASPAKWHVAHTSWFFETFILREFAAGYQPFHPDFLWLFNSYYNSVSDQPAKRLRASFSRPTLQAILEYRGHVDAAVEQLFAEGPAPAEAVRRLVLGLHHEQQHQELLVTDAKHAFWSNPLRPTYAEGVLPGADILQPQRWVDFAGGLQEIGYAGRDFCFDNEQPRHRVYLEPFELATRPVSSAEYLQFMQDGGYSRADLWLAEGWQAAQDQHWEAPLYWHRESASADWRVFTLRGERPLNTLLATPVCHLSYFEADAFARWAGAALPTEAEWELAAAVTGTTPDGHDMMEGAIFHPMPAGVDEHRRCGLLLGGVWEWTASAYLGYPGYSAVPGPLGEYNGKFMSGQMVLRGGSIATPITHIRETYRNFFPPATRWQFSGLRLARR